MLDSESDTVFVEYGSKHSANGALLARSLHTSTRTGQRSLDLIEAMYAIAVACQPITGRGVGYKLFTQGLIPSMGRRDMNSVYRLLKEAREEVTIPWEWIVDETRELEKVTTWKNPAAFVRTVSRAYRLDFWDQHPDPFLG